MATWCRRFSLLLCLLPADYQPSWTTFLGRTELIWRWPLRNHWLTQQSERIAGFVVTFNAFTYKWNSIIPFIGLVKRKRFLAKRICWELCRELASLSSQQQILDSNAVWNPFRQKVRIRNGNLLVPRSYLGWNPLQVFLEARDCSQGSVVSEQALRVVAEEFLARGKQRHKNKQKYNQTKTKSWLLVTQFMYAFNEGQCKLWHFELRNNQIAGNYSTENLQLWRSDHHSLISRERWYPYQC